MTTEDLRDQEVQRSRKALHAYRCLLSLALDGDLDAATLAVREAPFPGDGHAMDTWALEVWGKYLDDVKAGYESPPRWLPPEE